MTINAVGKMQITAVTDHGDDTVSVAFELDDKTSALVHELGLKLLMYCGATGTDLDYVFKTILGEEE